MFSKLVGEYRPSARAKCVGRSHKVDIRCCESNLGPYDCEAVALPPDHGHHIMKWLGVSSANAF